MIFFFGNSKMKIGFFLLVLLKLTVVFGQKRSFGFYGGTTINYRKLSSNLDYMQKFDSKVNLFNAGLFYGKSISSKFTLITGLDYSVIGYNRKPIIWYTNQATFSTKIRLGYVGIPLLIEMKLLHIKNFKISIAPGIINKFLVLGHYSPYNIVVPPYFSGIYNNYGAGFPKPVEIKLSNSDLNQLKYNRYMPELVADLIFGFKTKKVGFGISPQIRYSLLSTTKHNSYFHTNPEHLYSYGIKFFILKNW